MCEPGTETEDPEERRGRFSGFAKDGNADLIVAGAYGRSRLGEWMFGGVTHELLAKSQLCCLFSHGNGREV